MMVEGPAIRLDDEPRIWPMSVHLVTEHQDVGLWERKPVLLAELEEAILERRSGRLRSPRGIDQGADCA
jgi:hypothetical protein